MYLTKLRALSTKNQLTDELTKLTKPGSVSFVSDRSKRFSENECPEVNNETAPIISRNSTSHEPTKPTKPTRLWCPQLS